MSAPQATPAGPTLQSGQYALSDYSRAQLQAGKYYAIRFSEHGDEAEQILTEDAFSSHVPDGYKVVQAISKRTYMFVKYEPDYTKHTGEITGLSPHPDAAAKPVSADDLRKRRGRIPHSRDFADGNGMLPGMLPSEPKQKPRREVEPANTSNENETAENEFDSLD